MPNDNEPRGEGSEKNRVCPSCRMTISFLATKCRYCGEEVGKPKEETRALTVEALGGETIYHRAPSGSVMDALESFRLEEAVTNEAAEEEAASKSGGFMFKKSEPVRTPTPTRGPSDLPDLDARSRELADAATGEPSTIIRRGAPKKKKQKKQGLQDRLMLGGGVAIAIIVVLFAGIKGVRWVQAYVEERNTPPVDIYVNRAPELIERGAPPLEILDEAVKALQHTDSSENKKYIELAVERVVAEFERLVYPERSERPGTWSMEKLTQASALAMRAIALYPNERTGRMQTEISAELSAYKMTLVQTKPDEAQFAVNSPAPSTKWYKRDELIGDRFKVTRIIGPVVKVEDTKRLDARGNPRIVTYEVGSTTPL